MVHSQTQNSYVLVYALLIFHVKACLQVWQYGGACEAVRSL